MKDNEPLINITFIYSSRNRGYHRQQRRLGEQGFHINCFGRNTHLNNHPNHHLTISILKKKKKKSKLNKQKNGEKET